MPINWRDAHIIGEIGANTKAGSDALFKVLMQLPRLFKRQAITKSQNFRLRVYL